MFRIEWNYFEITFGTVGVIKMRSQHNQKRIFDPLKFLLFTTEMPAREGCQLNSVQGLINIIMREPYDGFSRGQTSKTEQ